MIEFVIIKNEILNYSLKSNPFYKKDFNKNNNNNWKQTKFSHISKYLTFKSTYFTH